MMHRTRTSPRAILVLLATLGTGVASCGCRSVTDYRAADLPDRWRTTGPSSPARVDLSAIARQSISADLIYPGDVLEVTLATGVEDQPVQTWPLRVSDTGQVSVPLVGEVPVAGRTLIEAEQEIRQLSIEREILRQPHVAVLMKQRRTVHVRVVGAVERPGVYELPAAGSDLLAAIVAAGGLSAKADTVVEIRHPNASYAIHADRNRQPVRLASFVESAETPLRTVRVDLVDRSQDLAELDLHVEDGTVVMVAEKSSHTISVIGLVRRPDSYPLPTDEPLRVLDAIALAGGPRVSVADRVRVIRPVADQDDPLVIRVSLRKAKRNGRENLILAAGDTISVEETPGTFLVESLQNIMHFGFTSAIPSF